MSAAPPAAASTALARAPLWQCALLAIVPTSIVLALVLALFDAGPRRFLPFWTDEVVYWNEAAVFGDTGFGGGYTVIQEEPARAAFTHFGPHGPVFPAFHGAIAAVWGWRAYSAFLVNLALVSLAALAWIHGARGGTSAPAVLVLASFWPLLLYLPTNMQEPTHFAFAFLFALAIDRDARGAAGTRRLAWTAALLAVAALVRPSWALLVLPLFWQTARRSGVRAVVLLLLAAAAATAVAWTAFDVLAAPSPHNTRALTRAWLDTPADALAQQLATTTRNLRQYIALDEEGPQIVFRYFLALFVALLGIRCVARPADAARALAVETALLAVVPVLVLVVLVGEVESWRDYRVLAPHLLVALLVLVPHRGWERWLWAVTLAALPVHYYGFIDFHRDRFTTDPAPIAAMHDATATTMPFVPGADPWANTITVHAEQLQFPLLGLPRGIGISYVFDWANLPDPVRSRYLLLRPEDEPALSPRVRLVPLSATPLGTLYRNDGPEVTE
jgi:hypothetical protein